jgi:Protein of unknown function (DUF732)
MRPALAFVLASALVLGACRGGEKSGPNTAAFLTLMHQTLSGDLSTSPDANLLAIGRRACADMDRGLAADQVVADIGGNPEPGSGAFNAYSFLAVAAARELCPNHKSQFSGAAIPSG